ncbi:FeoB-associated Cys-rich membrane protein [Acetobacterium woodii]
MATLIIGSMVIGALIFALFQILKKQKSGSCNGCSECSRSNHCNK